MSRTKELVPWIWRSLPFVNLSLGQGNAKVNIGQFCFIQLHFLWAYLIGKLLPIPHSRFRFSRFQQGSCPAGTRSYIIRWIFFALGIWISKINFQILEQVISGQIQIISTIFACRNEFLGIKQEAEIQP